VCGKLLTEHSSEELVECQKQKPQPQPQPTMEKLLKDIEEILTESLTIMELQKKLIETKGYQPNVLQDLNALIRQSKLKLTL
jgi:hypothetical protein